MRDPAFILTEVVIFFYSILLVNLFLTSRQLVETDIIPSLIPSEISFLDAFERFGHELGKNNDKFVF